MTDTANTTSGPAIDRWTIAGLALLLTPLLTMAHEIGGHAASCAALGHKITEIGAFYAGCDVDGTLAGRLVSAAGPAMDVIIALVGYQIWQRLRSDLARLVAWYVWLCCGFSAAGYFAYSGVTGIGDLNPAEGDGIGPLPYPLAFRALFALGGALAYWRLYLLGNKALSAMIGQGLETKAARRSIAHIFYAVACATAVLVGLLNPIGLFITLASAAAATFGGKAGLISIGYATHDKGEPLPFTIGRSWPIVVAGIMAALAFAIVLGPSLSFA